MKQLDILYKDYFDRLIIEDESIIGTANDILKYFKDEIKLQLDDNTLSFEEIRYNTNLILELLENLEKDNNIVDSKKIEVTYNPMGNFQYKECE